MYYIVVTLIALITGFFIGRMNKKKPIIKECDHDYDSTFSNCKDLKLECRFSAKEKKMNYDINVLYSICKKCKEELIVVGDGTTDNFYFEEELYFFKMRELRKNNELKIQMNIPT